MSEAIVKNRSHTHYRPDIDGLRAIAILGVVFYHAFPEYFKSGFIGVDIFFVISGYLITQIIAKELNSNSFSFRDFFIRRVNRIFPALILVLISVLILGWFVLLTPDFLNLLKHLRKACIFLINFTLKGEVGYFDERAEFKPLLHLWSLAIEEQFYLLWPLILFFCFKAKQKLTQITAILVLGSFSVYCYYIFSGNSEHAFYYPYGRWWEILAGAFLALYINSIRNQIFNKLQSNFFSFLGIGLLCVLFFITTQNNVAYFKPLVIFGTICLLASQEHAFFNKYFLSNRLLVGIGLISFPLYLWHWPIFSLTRLAGYTDLHYQYIFLLILLSIILSIGTFYLLEKPIRFKYKHKKKRTAIYCCSLLFSLLISSNFIKSSKIISHLPIHAKTKQFTDLFNESYFPAGLQKSEKDDRIYSTQNNIPAKILFIGDSHMEHYASGIVKLYHEQKIDNAVMIAGGGCTALPFSIPTLTAERKHCTLVYNLDKVLNDFPSIHTIVFGGYWSADANLFDDSLKVDAIKRVENFLQKYNKKYRIIILLDNPASPQMNPRSIIKHTFPLKFDFTETIPLPAKTLKGNNEMKQICKNTGVQCFDPMEYLCPNNLCNRFYDNQKPIYINDDHFTASFVREKASVYLEKALK